MTLTNIHPTVPSNRKAIFPMLWRSIKSFYNEARNRRAIRSQLSNLPDRYLRDIGLTQSDVQATRGLPLFRDAATEITTRARTQSRNW